MENVPELFLTEFNLLKTKLARLDRAFRKFKKEIQPPSVKKQREPSGFAKPTYLSPILCEFLSVSEGTHLARTEVTKRVLQYVKDKNLQNPELKREILMDEYMTKLLQPVEGDHVTYFNIQRLLKVHYINPNLDTVVDNTVVDNTVVDNTVVDNTVVDNTVVDNTVVDNTVVIVTDKPVKVKSSRSKKK
jgi:upstream activation factor subunit UAF30